MDVLKRLFEQHFQLPAEQVQPLQGQLGGSGRAIVRLTGGGLSAIGILYSVREENVAFLEFSRHFRRHGLPVPEIYAEDLSQGAYLEEDLGDTTLFEFLGENRAGETIAPQAIEAYRKVVAVLPRFQVEAGRDLNYKVCYPRASFDRQSIAWDLNYFKYYFLRLAGVPFNEQALEHDFGRLTKFLLSAEPRLFSLSGFSIAQCDAARRASRFFWTTRAAARARCNTTLLRCSTMARPTCRRRCGRSCSTTISIASASYIELERDAFMEHYYAYVYVRILQALGAYGFRGFYERKAHFLQSVPYALKNLRWLAENVKLPIALPALMDALEGMLASEKLQGLLRCCGDVDGAHFQFFVSPRDARRRDREWRRVCVRCAQLCPTPAARNDSSTLPGKDAPVIDYLNQQESVHQFLAQRSVACGCERGAAIERADLRA